MDGNQARCMRLRPIRAVLLVLIAAFAWLAPLRAGWLNAAEGTASPGEPGLAGAAEAPAGPATSPTTRPHVGLVGRVLVVSVDGLRPDMLLRCRTPNMHELFENGTYSFWART